MLIDSATIEKGEAEMNIFISYRRNDSARDVGRIRDRLKIKFGEQSVFRDLVDIPAGVDFRTVLDQKTNDCDVMLVVIGPLWAGIAYADGNKRLFDPADFTRIEVETGLRRLAEGKTMVVPVLLMNTAMPSVADLPESLSSLTFQNAIRVRDDPDFDEDMNRLSRNIRQYHGYDEGDISIESFEPKTVKILEGPFLMGSPAGGGFPESESPQHEITLPEYCIGKFPVTNSQYQEFILETRRAVSPVLGWEDQNVPSGSENHPVTGVKWYEALAYCQWLSQVTRRKYSLPNEAQWEKACRAGRNFLYPWGDVLEPNRSNHGCATLAAVDAYPAQNRYELFDLVGNIKQWTCTLWGEKRIRSETRFSYPWKDDPRNDINANSQLRRVMRGCSLRDPESMLRCSTRSGHVPEEAGFPGMRHGFRVVLNLEDS